MEQEQLYAAVIIIGVIFSILTNVALYYYGEAKDLKRKVNQGEYLYVRGEDWIEREIRKHHDDRLTQLENRIDNLVSTEFDSRVDLKNELFVMGQEVDLIKFAKGVDIVRREFLFGKLREIDRRIYDVKDMVNGGKGVSDGSKKG